MKKTTTWDKKEPFLMKMVLMICSIMRKVLVTTRLKKNKKKQKQNNNNTGRPRRQIVSQSDGSISIPSLFRIRLYFLSFFFLFFFSFIVSLFSLSLLLNCYIFLLLNNADARNEAGAIFQRRSVR